LFADTGTHVVYAGTTPQNAQTVIDIVLDEIGSIVEAGITDEELERAKGHIKGSLVISGEDPGSRMNRIGRQQLTTGEIASIDELIHRYDSVTMEDVRRVADTIFASKRFSVTVVGPFDEDAFDRFAA
jgi:predicted Zn-dependent peptidase